jgi:hypothetical protein
MRSSDGKGLDYQIVWWCDYAGRYQAVKIKYRLKAMIEPCYRNAATRSY